ncbi:5'-methylthioadenosine/adenosylhomocysteine nucleosidase [Alteromonas sp. 5E99-2]|uniref:5'-methylthioadenosine/adenosylhomocysteine nucleosidase n=1 Tax=Alteromonas sp. 5E99-2 TaxID=2817683 RepID=UPI001A97DC62|nr:5'-methylthioadenosine/adenosylhomocysteine nucleosidase [Alteromonas sp. 5E99-2]MBO1256351.1 5'-methylthioadenosine/adenosylhomocysteine nucleosidase [Alteromonas sp. 5E99-2]
MKIGILGAMDQEVALLKDSLVGMTETKWAHLTFYEGKIHDLDIVLVKCGIGKVASAVATTALIHQFSPDFVVNTGSAGGFDSSLQIGDIVIATDVVHHDVDVTHFGYALGQMAGMPETYSCNSRLIEAAESALSDINGVKSTRGLICTGDSFIGSDEAAELLRTQFPNVAAAEMEGAAIGQTCFMLDVPFLVIRSLSDIAGVTSTVSFNKYIETASENSAQLVISMIKELSK